MQRFQLEHLIRACGDLVEDAEFVIIGSQSILGAIPNPPAILTQSMEADLYPDGRSQGEADAIEGVLGELSQFHDTHGYYAQVVGPETAILPRSWRDRVVVIDTPNTRGARGLCISPQDLAMAKYAAGRAKDLEFNLELARHQFVERAVLEELSGEMPVDAAMRQLIRDRIARTFDSDPHRSARPNAIYRNRMSPR